MGQRKVIETYYKDVNNLTELLGKLVSSYRLLIGAADELNKIALSKKSDVRDALKRAEKLGETIDDIIKILDDISFNYGSYCQLKSDIIKEKMSIDYIVTEIQEDLCFKE